MGRLIRRAPARRLFWRFSVGWLALAALLGACTGSPSGQATTTSSVASGPTTSIVPVTVPGTLQSGALASLGSVRRLPVMPVPPGRESEPLPAPGAAGYSKVVQIAYRQTGSGSPLVLISGEDASMTWWAPALLATLSQRYSVTVFDLPGVGYSGPSRGPESVQWLGDVTAGLVGELGLSSPAVLGWGLGGQVALALAERHPSLVGELVLDETGLAIGGSVSPMRSADRLMGDPTATPAAVSSRMFPPSQQVARSVWLRELSAQVPDVVTSAAVTAEAGLESECWHSDSIVRHLRGIHLPALVVGGTEDAVFPLVDTTALAAAIPGAQRYVVPGGGYGELLEDPPQVVSTIEAFIG